MSDSFSQALIQGLTDYNLDEVDFIYTGDPGAVPPRRGIVLGTVPDEMIPDEVYYAPSIREMMFTAGGFTKFKYAINLFLNGRTIAPFHEYTVITPDMVMLDEEPYDQPVVVDIEVSGSVEDDEPEDCDLLAVSLCYQIGDELQILAFGLDALEYTESRKWLAKLLANNHLIGHNLKFDLRWVNVLLADYLELPLSFEEDTMLAHHSLFHGAAEHGLKPLCHRIFGAPDWEGDIKQYTKNRKGQFQMIPQNVLLRYNSQDVYWTWQLWQQLQFMLAADPDAARVYEIEKATARMYQEVEAYGVWVDLQYAVETEIQMMADAAVVEAELIALTGVEKFNPRSPIQVKKYLASVMPRPPASTDKKNLARLVMNGEQLEFITLLLRARKISKLLGSYVRPPLKRLRRDRVHPVFLVHGTSTGRTSCKNPALQTLPNEDEEYASIRRMYGAPPGNVIVGCDYAQAELRVMAELSGDELMIADLDSDVDFFDNLLPAVFPDVDFAALDKGQRKPYRLRLKRIVYGLSYGRQAAAIAEQLTIEDGAPTTVAEAQTIIDNYLGRYSTLAAWRKSIMKTVIGDELVSPYGRRFQQDIVSEVNYVPVENAALAFLPQSTANDICLTAARRVHERFRGTPCHIILTVHDAIYAEGPEGYASVMQGVLQYEMKRAAREVFNRLTFEVDGHVGRYLSEV